jgi:hypothetical protein
MSRKSQAAKLNQKSQKARHILKEKQMAAQNEFGAYSSFERDRKSFRR